MAGLIVTLFPLFRGKKLISNLFKIPNSWELRRTIKLLIKFKNFPLVSTWSILLGNSSWFMPVILMSFYFDPMFVGLYAFGFRIFQMPISLIATSVSQIFFRQGTLELACGTFSQLVNIRVRLTSALVIMLYLFMLLEAENLFQIIFGDDWSEAGKLIQYLSPWAFLWFVTTTLTPTFSILQKQRVQLLWNVFNFTSRISAVIIAGLISDEYLLINLLGILGILIYGAKLIIIMRISGIQLVKMKYFMFRQLAAVAICYLALLTLTDVKFAIALQLMVVFLFSILNFGIENIFLKKK